MELWGDDFYKKINISGGSAGTIFAVGIALGKSPEALDSLYRKVAENTNKYGPVYYASRFMTEGLRDLLDDPKAHRTLEGRCMIGTTSCFATHRWSVSLSNKIRHRISDERIFDSGHDPCASYSKY